MRRYPQSGFSVANRRTSSRTTQAVGGRPVVLRAERSTCVPPVRCQRSSVVGCTKNTGQRSRGSAADNAASTAWSAGRVADGRLGGAARSPHGARPGSRRPCSYPCGHATPAVRTVGVSVDTPARRSRRASCSISVQPAGCYLHRRSSTRNRDFRTHKLPELLSTAGDGPVICRGFSISAGQQRRAFLKARRGSRRFRESSRQQIV